jgi:hypothetical protein
LTDLLDLQDDLRARMADLHQQGSPGP